MESQLDQSLSVTNLDMKVPHPAPTECSPHRAAVKHSFYLSEVPLMFFMH